MICHQNYPAVFLTTEMESVNSTADWTTQTTTFTTTSSSISTTKDNDKKRLLPLSLATASTVAPAKIITDVRRYLTHKYVIDTTSSSSNNNNSRTEVSSKDSASIHAGQFLRAFNTEAEAI